MPQVSVVMAVHNEPEHIIDAAIYSIISQTVSDLELIICDDGSNAATVAALSKWNNADSRLCLIRNDVCLGAGAARNRAISLAKSEYIAIMDADDISVSTRLEKELAFLSDNHQFAFVGTRGQLFINTPGDITDTYWYVDKPTNRDFLMTLPFVHASVLFRRNALYNAGGYRCLKRVKRSEDYDLLMRLYAAGYIGANIPQILYYIRTDESTLKRRKYRYRFTECAVKLEGFSRMRLMPVGILYAIKPLVVGLIPIRLLNYIKTKYYKQ